MPKKKSDNNLPKRCYIRNTCWGVFRETLRRRYQYFILITFAAEFSNGQLHVSNVTLVSSV